MLGPCVETLILEWTWVSTAQSPNRGSVEGDRARVGALAEASELLAAQTVKDLTVGSGLTFEDRGEHELKGVRTVGACIG